MPTEGKLEVTIKFNQFPTEITRDKNGWVSFAVDCGPGLVVQFHVRPKIFMKLEQAQKDWPQWVAAATGKIGERTAQGFFLLEPGVQVFEKKAKEPVVHKADPIPTVTSAPTDSQG
jgi:hypothetical protein